MRSYSKSIILLLVLPMVGCTLGPHALRVSTSDYNRAIQYTTDEQLLLNLVRLKYRDTPLFVEIGSVSSQFTFGSGANISGTIYENVSPNNVPNILGLGGRISYDDKPTITYTPLRGEDFVQRLMSPIEIDTIMLLYYSGWSVDRITRLTVQSINGIENAMTASGPTPALAPSYVDFGIITSRLRELQQKRALNIGYDSKDVPLSDSIVATQINGTDLVAAAQEGFRFSKMEDSGDYVLTGSKRKAVLFINPDSLNLPETREMTNILKLAPNQTRFPINRSYTAPLPTDAGYFESLTISTRSLSGALFYLSQAVEIPKEHQDAGFVTVTHNNRGHTFDWSQVTGDLLQIRCDDKTPRSAAVAIKHRGYWFYIDDKDLNSKSTFNLLGQLFSLQAGGVKAEAPVLTLPIGN